MKTLLTISKRHATALKKTLCTVLGMLVVGSSSVAHAELDFGGPNRFVFEEGAQRFSIVVANKSEYATLIQASLAWGDGRQQELPVALNKPLQVLMPNGLGGIEVFYEGSGFVADRESYLLLSVLDVSQAPREPDSVQLALMHRFKFFFRPKLEQSVEQAIANLRWQGHASGAPTIENTSPYFITLSDIELRGQGNRRCGQTINHVMVAPFSSATLENSECNSAVSSVRYDYVTDGGSMRAYEASLSATESKLGEQV
ncbi:MAG: fimbrial biogenesis chaperone [Paenalcaligenes sp.]